MTSSSSPKASDKAVVQLADHVGDFIRYWGFRRIHGQIWTLLYLHSDPLGPTELAERLGVSKALISSALEELLEHELIEELAVPNNKKAKLFQACEDVIGVIQKVLKKRELKIVASAEKAALEMQRTLESKTPYDADRLAQVLAWTQMAKGYLTLISEFDDLTQLSLGDNE